MAKNRRLGWAIGMWLGMASIAAAQTPQSPMYPDPAPIQRAPMPAAQPSMFPAYGGMPAPSSPPGGSGLIMPPHMLYPPGFPLWSQTGPMPYGAYPDDGALDEPLWYTILSDIFTGNFESQPSVQLTLGWTALKRDRLKHRVLAVQDPSTIDDPDVPVIRPPTVLDANSLTPDYLHGMKASLRVFGEEDDAVEFGVTYLPNHADSFTVARPGQVNGFFFNPPLGFEGNNGLWDNADFVRLTLASEFISAELNKRWMFGEDGIGGEFYVGARYTYFRELLGLTFNDDALAIANDLTEEAVYYVRARNHMVYGQVGIELYWHIWSWLGIGWEARGAWGGNRSQIKVELIRGDGLVGRTGYSHNWNFTHNYETGLFFHVNGSFWRMRAGWSVFWLVGVAAAENQIDFNLENVGNRRDTGASIFYHGPTFVIDFAF